MSDELKAKLAQLEADAPGMSSTFFEIGRWLIELGKLQLEIARSITERLPEDTKTL